MFFLHCVISRCCWMKCWVDRSILSCYQTVLEYLVFHKAELERTIVWNINNSILSIRAYIRTTTNLLSTIFPTLHSYILLSTFHCLEIIISNYALSAFTTIARITFGGLITCSAFSIPVTTFIQAKSISHCILVSTWVHLKRNRCTNLVISMVIYQFPVCIQCLIIITQFILLEIGLGYYSWTLTFVQASILQVEIGQHYSVPHSSIWGFKLVGRSIGIVQNPISDNYKRCILQLSVVITNVIDGAQWHTDCQLRVVLCFFVLWLLNPVLL